MFNKGLVAFPSKMATGVHAVYHNRHRAGSQVSYLKELLIRKVQRIVDRLPFTSEGYERAKPS